MTEHEAFIRQCIALSEQAVRHGNEPFGALLVVDGDVRLTAQNQVLIESDPTRHAELLLASEAARRLDAAARDALHEHRAVRHVLRRHLLEPNSACRLRLLGRRAWGGRRR